MFRSTSGPQSATFTFYIYLLIELLEIKKSIPIIGMQFVTRLSQSGDTVGVDNQNNPLAVAKPVGGLSECYARKRCNDEQTSKTE